MYVHFNEIAMLFLLMFIMLSCRNSQNDNPLDTPTTGKISMAVDETFMPIVQAQLDVFHSVYRYAHIEPIALPESEAFKLLYDDSVKLILASRKLSDKEVEYFNQKKIFPKQVKIAIDAIAMIVNRQNPDSVYTVDELAAILKGEITNWSQLNNNNHSGNIELMFDNPKSGLVRYMIDSVAHTNALSKSLISGSVNTDVINYVSRHINAAGFIGVSWISDKDDSTRLSFQNNIRVARLGKVQKTDAYKPYQAYIATEQYPLTRDIYLISTDPHLGLAEGFISFAASDKGQRIILKAGILPATATIRLVNVHDE